MSLTQEQIVEGGKPVQLLFDADGYLIRAGDFNVLGKKDKKAMVETILSGGSVKTITIGEYRATEFKWIWDKPKQ